MAEATTLRNNALPYPVYGVPWSVVFPMLDADGDLVTGATTPDAEVSKNGDTFADCTNESTEIATSSGMYYLALTATEMTADIVAVIAKSATAGMKTTPIVLYPRKLVTLRSGTVGANAADGSTLQLDSSASAVDDYYNGCLLVGTLDSNVEARIITDYVGSTKVCSVTPNFVTTPDNNDTFVVYLPEGRQVGQADAVAIAGAAVSTSSAQIGVNVVNAGGTAWGSGAITAASIAADAITAAKIANGAIDAATFAADVDAEILSYIVDDATRIDASALNTATVTTIPAILVDTGTTLDGKIDTIDGIVDSILVDTAEIGAAGAGLTEAGGTGDQFTSIPWNSSWDTEVQSEVDDALVAQNLDHLIKIAVDTNFATTVHADSVIGQIADNGAGFDRSTDSLEVIRDKLTDIETDTAEIGAAGAGLSNINLPDQTMNITGDITGNLSGSVGSVTGAVGSVTGNVGGNVTGSVGSVAAGGITASSIAADAIGASELAADAANEIADALLDRSAGIETGWTFRQAMRVMLSALAGKASGLETTTAVYRDVGDSKDRITATVDADGNRTAVTLDAT